MPESDSLERYRSKRDPARTPEPAGEGAGRASGAAGGGAFVVHQHAASRLHFDLRLEVRGVLESWAVPKGPSLDPADKRLAVHVEPHPIEYLDFEDVIPAGGYGAGPMIIWDRGTWHPIEDPIAGLESGKLLFELRGYKLRGVWTLVKMAKSDNEWLMIREKKFSTHAEGQPGGVETLPAESVMSGFTIEELGEGVDPGPALLERLEESGAKRRAVDIHDVKMMLARPRRTPFSDPEWVFELKLDGFRMLGGKTHGGPALITRNGNDAAATFPEIAAALDALPYDEFILDGEVVVHDESGFPSFQRIQRRAQQRRPVDIERGARHQPATFYAFDLVSALGFDVRSLTLLERKDLLRALLPPIGPLRYVEHFVERGEALFDHVTGLRLEGIVGKQADSRYRGGRSSAWAKIRADRTEDLVIVGFTDPKGTRHGFGALHVAGYRDDALVYAGRVGTGFSAEQLDALRDTLDGIERDTSPCENAPTGSEHHWTEPELVCEVRYLEWTEDGLLRQPAFLRLRDDKPPEACRLPETDADQRAPLEPPAPAVEPPGTPTPPAGGPAPDEVKISNPDKVFWPRDGYTKSDLCDYYEKIAPAILPYLEDRPLVLTRFPDGIDGKSFYQKNTPGFVPDWIRTVGIWSESSDRELAYVVCDDAATLVYLANLGTIPLHIWASRVESLDNPDWCILDLDPKQAPFEHVIEIAKALHELCSEIDLPAYVKTSGSSGLHVLIPLDGRFDYEMSRTLGELIGRAVVARLPKIATLERKISERQGKVYIDYLQNRRGQLLVAPYSVRPLDGAPVSAPLRWREVQKGLDLGRFNIESMPRRLGQMKDDPFRPVLGGAGEIVAALERLQALLAE